MNYELTCSKEELYNAFKLKINCLYFIAKEKMSDPITKYVGAALLDLYIDDHDLFAQVQLLNTMHPEDLTDYLDLHKINYVNETDLTGLLPYDPAPFYPKIFQIHRGCPFMLINDKATIALYPLALENMITKYDRRPSSLHAEHLTFKVLKGGLINNEAPESFRRLA